MSQDITVKMIECTIMKDTDGMTNSVDKRV